MERAALVTGGSSGIGLAIARVLHDEGFDLTLVSRRAEKVEAAAAELGATRDRGRRLERRGLRAARRRAPRAARPARRARQLRRRRHRRHGRDSLPAKHLDLQLGVNLRGLFLVTQAAIPLLRESRGWIVNLASIAGTLPTPGLATYGATKAAVISLTRSLNEELDEDGVRAMRDLPGVRRHADGGSGRASRPTR